MSNVSLDGRLIKLLTNGEKIGGIGGLRDHWADYLDQKGRPDDHVPVRQTIYRWFNGQLPRSDEHLILLCALLDVDPFGVLVLPKGKEQETIQRLHRSFWSGVWRQPALGFMSEFFGQQTIWPPPSVSSASYRHPWCVQEFSLDPSIHSHVYAMLELKGAPEVFEHMPQVFHVAYQEPENFFQKWIQYGFVVRHQSSVRLVNITGDTQSYITQDARDPTFVETRFGTRLTNFRVASIHPHAVTIKGFDLETDEKVSLF